MKAKSYKTESKKYKVTNIRSIERHAQLVDTGARDRTNFHNTNFVLKSFDNITAVTKLSRY